jgi:hypothetical protein
MSQKRTRIWRMTHYRNIEFILLNGLHCCNCPVRDSNYINIGFRSLSSKRGQREVNAPSGGVLNDYIPFYFHNKMPMLHKIFKGEVNDYQGKQEDIVYLVSSVEHVMQLGCSFIFTDRHAYLDVAHIYHRYEDLAQLNWSVIEDDTWFRQYTISRKELKQAEFLIHQQLPVEGILGLVAHNDEVANFVLKSIKQANLDLQVVVRPQCYFQ